MNLENRMCDTIIGTKGINYVGNGCVTEFIFIGNVIVLFKCNEQLCFEVECRSLKCYINTGKQGICSFQQGMFYNINSGSEYVELITDVTLRCQRAEHPRTQAGQMDGPLRLHRSQLVRNGNLSIRTESCRVKNYLGMEQALAEAQDSLKIPQEWISVWMLALVLTLSLTLIWKFFVILDSFFFFFFFFLLFFSFFYQYGWVIVDNHEVYIYYSKRDQDTSLL